MKGREGIHGRRAPSPMRGGRRMMGRGGMPFGGFRAPMHRPPMPPKPGGMRIMVRPFQGRFQGNRPAVKAPQAKGRAFFFGKDAKGFPARVRAFVMERKHEEARSPKKAGEHFKVRVERKSRERHEVKKAPRKNKKSKRIIRRKKDTRRRHGKLV